MSHRNVPSNVGLFMREKIFLSFLLILAPLPGFSLDDVPLPQNIRSLSKIEPINATEVILENGLRVIIKQTNFDADEVFVQMIASGGYASSDKEYLPSAMLAAKIAKESGPGSNYQLNYDLYRDSIEFSVEIDKNLRTIDASGPSKSLGTILKLIEGVFTEQKFNQAALEAVVTRERTILNNRSADRDMAFEVMYTRLNTIDEPALMPLTIKDLDHVSLEKASGFYASSFTNPQDFHLIIVGDLNLEQTLQLLSEGLGKLKNHPSIKVPCCLKLPAFPEGVVKRVIPSKVGSEAYERITFLLNTKYTPHSVFLLEMTTLLIEKRLRDVMVSETGKANGIDVGYQLPLFPYTKPLWITMTFRSKKKDVSKIESLIIKTLKEIQAAPVSEVDFNEIKLNLMAYDEFWQKDNSYWQASLANYSLWDWDLKSLGKVQEDYKPITKEELSQFIKEAFSTESYTVLLSQ